MSVISFHYWLYIIQLVTLIAISILHTYLHVVIIYLLLPLNISVDFLILLVTLCSVVLHSWTILFYHVFTLSAQQRQSHQRKSKSKSRGGPTPLFDDTSTGPPPPEAGPTGGMPQNPYGSPAPGMQPGFPGQQLMNDPMANMAMQYGASLADQGKDVMEKQVWKLISP